MQNTVWHNWLDIFSDFSENANFTYLLLVLMVIRGSGATLKPSLLQCSEENAFFKQIKSTQSFAS